MTSRQSEAAPKPAPEFPFVETLPARRLGFGRMMLPILLVGIPGAVLLVLGLSGCRRAEQVEEVPAGTGVAVTAARAREADLQYRRGLEAAQKNDMQTAVPHLERAVELNPEHPRAQLFSDFFDKGTFR